jgi:hypothetical protein
MNTFHGFSTCSLNLFEKYHAASPGAASTRAYPLAKSRAGHRRFRGRSNELKFCAVGREAMNECGTASNHLLLLLGISESSEYN